ncbi:predicted protein [Naegleria gruberi]|uniref:Predicted protein n=1 Tax=Naegleria gruberi TaxID=5762 RepID=D2VX42_NAEGR|nr:uncharacterized protein NAEGRDRAFT_73611 [Naegleria gruberi]EFC38558.1 predicted protein [Naegleria gruberi]|eukprot:XP_002671302.1 predicted protein [Naegleria gruberi strain NEG-M]
MRPKSYNPLDPIIQTQPDAGRENLQLKEIFVRGVEATSESKITAAFQEAKKATTLNELNEAISIGLERVGKLDVLNNVNVILDADDSKNVALVLDCKEKQSTRLSAGTTVNDKGQVKGEISFGYRNLLGQADRWDVDANIDKTGLTLVGRTFLPQSFNNDGALYVSGFLNGGRVLTNLLQEKSNGVSVRAEINDRHSISYDFEMRRNEDVGSMFKKASSSGSFSRFFSRFYNAKTQDSEPVLDKDDSVVKSQVWTEVKEQSVKSSLSHTYRFDTRNSSFAPSSGAFFKLVHRLAGLGGDVKHYSVDMNGEVFVPLISDSLVAALKLNVGTIIPLDRQNDTFISLNDRFIEKVRGFPAVGTVHPRSEEVYGGNIKAVATGRLVFPFPVSFIHQLLGLHCQAFCDIGNVSNINDYSENGVQQFREKFCKGLHTSYGFGLAMMLSFGRIEFNFAKPSTLFNDQTNLPPTLNSFKQFSIHYVFNE